MGDGTKSNNVYVYTGGSPDLKNILEGKKYLDLGEFGGNILWVSLRADYAYMHMQKEIGRVLWQFKIPGKIFAEGLGKKFITRSKANPSANFEVVEAFLGNNMPPITINEISNYHGGDVLNEP